MNSNHPLHLAVLLLILSGLLFLNPSHASVVNGYFDLGTSGWTWKQSQNLGHASCLGIPGHPGSRPAQHYGATSNNTLDYVENGYGLSASMIAGGPYSGGGHRTLCREAHQDLYIPVGSKLNFALRLGGNAFPSQNYFDSTLTVLAERPNGTGTRQLFTRSGKNRPCDSKTSPWTCPVLGDEEVDISDYWGQTIRLVFVGSSAYRSQFQGTPGPSQAFIDNVRLTQTALNPTASPQTGSWHNPARDGHGLNISRTSDGKLFVGWYTYRSDGVPVWYVTDPLYKNAGFWQSPLYKVTRNYAGGTTRSMVGSMKLDIYSSTSVGLNWTFFPPSGVGTTLSGGEKMRFLFGGGEDSGAWFNPETDGSGFTVDYVPGPQTATGTTAIGAFYFSGSEPVWAAGSAYGAPRNFNTVELQSYIGFGLCPECNGQPVSRIPSDAGSISLNLQYGVGSGWINVADSLGGLYQIGNESNPVSFYQITGN